MVAWLFIIIAVAVTMASVYKAYQFRGSCDMQYVPAVLLAEGKDPYAVYMQAFQEDEVARVFPLYQFPNYPVLGLTLMIPLTFLPMVAAKFVWALLNAVMAAVVCWRLCAVFKLNASSAFTWIVMSLFIISPSIRGTIGNGQTSIVTFLMFLLALEQAPKRPWLAGVCLAIAYYKYNVTLPLSFIFFLYPYWWVTLVAGAIHLLVIGLWAYGLGVAYWDILFGPLMVSKTATYLYGYADLWGMLRVARVPEWAPIVVACTLMACVLLWVIIKRTSMPGMLLLSFLSFFSLLIPYHSLNDNLVLVVPALLAIAALRSKQVGMFSWAGLYLAVIAKAWFGDRLFMTWDNAYQEGQWEYLLFLLNQTSTILLLWLCFGVAFFKLVRSSKNKIATNGISLPE